MMLRVTTSLLDVSGPLPEKMTPGAVGVDHVSSDEDVLCRGIQLDTAVAVSIDPVVADDRRSLRRDDVDAVVVIGREPAVVDAALLDRRVRGRAVAIRLAEVEADPPPYGCGPVPAPDVADVEAPPDRMASVDDRARQVPLVAPVDSQVLDDPVAAGAAQPDDAVQRGRMSGIEAAQDDRRVRAAASCPGSGGGCRSTRAQAADLSRGADAPTNRCRPLPGRATCEQLAGGESSADRAGGSTDAVTETAARAAAITMRTGAMLADSGRVVPGPVCSGRSRAGELRLDSYMPPDRRHGLALASPAPKLLSPARFRMLKWNSGQCRWSRSERDLCGGEPHRFSSRVRAPAAAQAERRCPEGRRRSRRDRRRRRDARVRPRGALPLARVHARRGSRLHRRATASTPAGSRRGSPRRKPC